TTLVFGAWPCTVRFPSVALRPGAVLPLFGGLTLPWPAALPRDAVTARRADTPALPPTRAGLDPSETAVHIWNTSGFQRTETSGR
ncbi:hypothetical protein, partial [Dactylosporangium aurantiacum]